MMRDNRFTLKRHRRDRAGVMMFSEEKERKC